MRSEPRGAWRILFAARSRMARHVPFAQLVAYADDARPDADGGIAGHVGQCARCASALRDIARVSAIVRPTAASPAETSAAVEAVRRRLLRTTAASEDPDSRGMTGVTVEVLPLLDTAAGKRVAGALTPWLGDTASRALLRHVRAGECASRDVLHAVAHPLTAFLGEEAGRALAVRVSSLARVSPDDEDPPAGETRAAPYGNATGALGTGA